MPEKANPVDISIVKRLVPVFCLVFLAFYLSALLIGIDWGLPSQKRMSLLLFGKQITSSELSRLTTHRQDCQQYQSLDVVFYGGNSRSTLASEKLSKFPTECIDGPEMSLRRFILYGVSQDESRTFSSLSRMQPSELDLHPGRFENGTAYLYPIGGILFLLKKINLLEISHNVGFYLTNPSEIKKLFVVGRVFSLLAVVGTLLLLYQLGGRYASSSVGLLSAIAYGSFETVYFLGVQSRVHVVATFFVTLAVYFLLGYRSTLKRNNIIYASLALGIAVGIVIYSAFAWIMVLFFVFTIEKEKYERLKNILLSGSVVSCVYVVTNPYSVIDYQNFISWWLMFPSGKDIGGHGYTPSLFTMLSQYWYGHNLVSLPRVPFVAASVIAVLWAVTSKIRPWNQLGIWVVLCELIFCSIGKSGTRLLMFTWPIISILLALFFMQLWNSINRKKIIYFVILLLVIAPAYGHIFQRSVGLLAHKAGDRWYSESINCLDSLAISRKDQIGLYDYPKPHTFPPFPFLGSELVLLHENLEMLPNYVVIRNGHDGEKWKANPISRNYIFSCMIKGAYSPRTGYLEQVASIYVKN